MRLILTLSEDEFGLLRDRAVSEFRTPHEHMRMLLYRDAELIKQTQDSNSAANGYQAPSDAVAQSA